MRTRHVALVDRTTKHIPFVRLSTVAAALQRQVDRDFAPIWGVRAVVTAFRGKDPVPASAWPIRILDSLPDPREGGVHLDEHHHPYAQVRHDGEWTISASHELVEMLADPYGHRFAHGPDIDPASDGHGVYYLVEVGDPCEVWAYTIDGIAVSDFITPEYYNANASVASELDFLGRLPGPLEVPQGCYLSWIDPEDGRWHQKTPDGDFVRARAKASSKGNPREDRDRAFADDEERHDLPAILARYAPARDGEAVALA